MTLPNYLPRDRSVATVVTDSATAAAGAMAPSLAAGVGLRTHLCGFQVTGLGATGASAIEIVTTGLATNLKWKLAIPAGATVGVTPLCVNLPIPVPASADNTAIGISVPSFGSGNTAAAISVVGFRV